MNEAPRTAPERGPAKPAPGPAPTGATGATDVAETAPGAPAPPPESRAHMIRRRALTLLLIVALIGVPAGYLVFSANVSRTSGRDHEERTEATGLIAGNPSQVQRSLYNVPVPRQHADVMSYETNNWRTSRLYVQFRTTQQGLNSFLTTMGVSPGALGRDDLPISARDRAVVDWDFSGQGDWRGLVHRAPRPRPTQRVVVNLADPRYPQVYVVSSTTP